jgi:hypothetical protein
MSRTCNLACHDCQVTLWVGQMHHDAWRIYGGKPEFAANLTAFLNAHESHRLEFGDSEQFDFYEDVTPDEEEDGAPKLSDVVIDLCERSGLTPDIPAIRALDQEHPASTRTYEIWREGFRATGDICRAKLLGRSEGATFRDAVLAYYAEHPDDSFDPATLRYWGCRHFDNEADAREAFG